MADLDELKRKAKDKLAALVDFSAEAYKIAEEKAKVLARRGILNAEIANEKSLIRRRKYEIGKAYYDMHKDEPEEALKENCDVITAAYDRIAAKRQEIENLKTYGLSGDDSDCCCTPKAETVECEPAAEPCDCGCEEAIADEKADAAEPESCDCGCEEAAAESEPTAPEQSDQE